MSSPQPSKRQRPNRATACDACQRRKSRCELIQLDGCLRCRTLGTECSVARYGSNGPHELAAGASFTASEHEHALSSGPEELVGLLREMSGRMARMEQEMTELRQAVHRTPSSYASTFDARRGCNLQRKLDERARGIPGLQGALAMTPAGMISRALVWDARSCNFEPVGACLMGEADWRGAMHRVQQHASNFTPMSLPVDSTNSFFRLAIFVFDSILYPSSDCDTHTRTAISHLHHNPDPHLHAMIGLYLLSFLPLHTNRGVVDEYNGAARAYRMAREIGLDVSRLGLIGAGPLEDHRSIWEVILVRHETVSMLSSATLRPDPSTGPANDCAAVLPPLLWLERAMLNEIQGIASLLVRLRCAEQHEPLTVVELESAINAFVHNSTWMQQASALTSSAFFILSRHLYTMSICLKISTDAPDLLPSPLNYDDRFGLIKCTAPNIVHGARKTIDFVAAHPGFDLRGLPAFHMMLCLTAYKAMHQSSLADHGASASTTPSSGTASNFALFKQKLEQSSPQVRRIVEGIDRHDGPDSSWREAMSHDALWEGLLADFGADELLFWPDFVGPDNFSFQY